MSDRARWTRRAGVAVTGAAAVVLVAASVAWACTVQSQLFALSPPIGRPGTAVEVRGKAIWTSGPERTQVEIRWDGVRGPVVGSAVADRTGAFSAMATVPDTAPGVYSLVVVVPGTDTGVTRTAFEVTAAPGAASERRPLAATAWGDSAGLDAADRASQTGLLAGGALLSFGLGALFSAFGVAAVRRRRAPAEGRRWR